MEVSLREALNVVLGREILRVQDDIAEAADLPSPAQGRQPAPGEPDAVEELREARSLLQEARDALQEGDFARFGDRLDALESVLDRGVSDAESLVPTDTTAAAVPQAGTSE